MPDPQQQMTIDESGAMNPQDIQAKLKALLANISKQVNTQSTAAPQGGPGAVAAQMAGPGGSAQQGGSVTTPGQLPTPGPQAPGGRPSAAGSPMTPMPATASPMNAPVGQYVPHSQREPRQYEFDTKKGAKTATVYDTVNAMSEIMTNIEKKNQASKAQAAEGLYTKFKNYYDQGNMEAAAFLFSDENKVGKKNRKMVQDVMGGIPEMPPEGMAFQKAHDKLQQGGQGQQSQGQPQQGQQPQQPQSQAKSGQQPQGQQRQYSQAALQQWFQQQALQKQATQLQGSIASAQQTGALENSKATGKSQGELPAEISKIEATGKQTASIQAQADKAAMDRTIAQVNSQKDVAKIETDGKFIQNPSDLAQVPGLDFMKGYKNPLPYETVDRIIQTKAEVDKANLDRKSREKIAVERDTATKDAAKIRAGAKTGQEKESDNAIDYKVTNILASPNPMEVYTKEKSGMNSATKQALDETLANRGIIISGGDLDKNLVRGAQQAQQIIPELDKWITKLSDPRIQNEFGPIMGRWNKYVTNAPSGVQALATAIGFNGDPKDFVEFRTFLEGFKQGQPFSSASRMMGGGALMGRMDGIIHSDTMQPKAMLETLSEFKADLEDRLKTINGGVEARSKAATQISNGDQQQQNNDPLGILK